MTPHRWREMLIICAWMFLSALQNLEGGVLWSEPCNGKQYMKLGTPRLRVNKERSRDYCRINDGFLPKPMNEAENNYLNNLRTNYDFFLGIKYLATQGDWVYDDDEKPLQWTGWKADEPNNAGGNKKCAKFSNINGWCDIDCDSSRWFSIICERRYIPTTTEPTTTTPEPTTTTPEPTTTTPKITTTPPTTTNEPTTTTPRTTRNTFTTTTNMPTTTTSEPATTSRPDCSPKLCGHHKCEVLDNDVTCVCLTGYENSSPLQCQDIDECKIPDVCYSHHCVNTNGSYQCRCRSGSKNIAPQICVKGDDEGFEGLSAQKNTDSLTIFDLEEITPLKVVATGVSIIVIVFILYSILRCSETISIATYLFATTKPLKNLHSEMKKKHYIRITYDEEEESETNSNSDDLVDEIQQDDEKKEHKEDYDNNTDGKSNDTLEELEQIGVGDAKKFSSSSVSSEDQHKKDNKIHTGIKSNDTIYYSVLSWSSSEDEEDYI